MATIDDFRTAGLLLAPSERVTAGETADVLSAVVAYLTHGSGVIDAARAGAQAVADYFHDVISANAATAGVDAPVKGNPVLQTPDGRSGPPPGAGASVSAADFDNFKREILTMLQSALAGAPPPAPPTAPVAPAAVSQPVPSPADTPAPAPAAPADTSAGDITQTVQA